jgi:hypothetical protein
MSRRHYTGQDLLPEGDFAGDARFNGRGRAFSVEGKRGIADLKQSDRRGYDGFAALSGRGRHRISYL